MTGTFKSHSTHDLKKRKEKKRQLYFRCWVNMSKQATSVWMPASKQSLSMVTPNGVKMGSGLLKQRRGIKHREIMATNNTTLLLRFLTHSNWVLNRDTAQLGIPASLSLAIFSVKKPFS